jgi:hypothetical protein
MWSRLNAVSVRGGNRWCNVAAVVMKRPKQRRLALSALIWSHINPYGTFHIDMNTHLDLDPPTSEAKAA